LLLYSYSLILKQKIKLCDAKQGQKQEQQKKLLGPIRKKKQLCTCSTLFCTFLCCCFERLQHRTSWLHILLRKCCMLVCGPVHFFFLTAAHFHSLIFTLVAASISHFLTPTIIFSCFSSIEICLLCFLSLSLSLFLCYPRQCGHKD